MTKFRVNIHAPRVLEQKYATVTVSVKEIETLSQAEEILSELNAIMPELLRKSSAQTQLPDDAGGTPEGKKNHALVKEKVTKKAKKEAEA